MHFSLDEIGLVPKSLSDVTSRKDVNPFYSTGLPIFVAPMTCIIDQSNFETFKKVGVTPIYPIRYNDLYPTLTGFTGWVSVTLNNFKQLFIDNPINLEEYPNYRKVLIDTANGHMHIIYNYVREAKQRYGNNLTVMVGNIANPDTYLECCRAGVDYVRVGIGGGSGCLTSCLTGFHTTLPWLLQEINYIQTHDIILGNDSEYYLKPFSDNIRECLACKTKVIADGGINSIDKAIKALALGADYVMMGKCFAECKEACGPIISGSKRTYYGQASEQGQKDRFGQVKSEPEGTSSLISVKYSLKEFTNKFEAALRSAMSYAGAFTLDQFIGKVRYQIQSNSEYFNYYKS